MGSKSLVKRRRRSGRPTLVIDFEFLDADGVKRRYRRDACVQKMSAARAEADRLVELAARTGSPCAKAAAPTFASFVHGDYARLYLPEHKPSTTKRYEAILRQGVAAFFGPRPLDRIDHKLAMRYAAELRARGVSPKGHIDFVRSVLRAAFAESLIASVPELPRYKKSEKLPSAPRLDEVIGLLGVATSWLHVAVALAAFAGLRSGEVRGLRVGDVDFEANVIHVRRAFSEDQLVDTTKNGRERIVPMAPELRAILGEAVKYKLPSAFVVTTARGTTPRRQHLWDRLHRLQTRRGLRQHSFHQLRHYFCSRLLKTGATIEAVRMLAGHSELRTTQLYVHAGADELEAAVGKIAGN